MRALLAASVCIAVSCAKPCEPEPAGEVGALTEWERQFLERRALPASPASAFVEAEDGLRLAYSEWVPTGWAPGQPVVLFVHGSSARGGLYSALGQGLADAGVLTRLIDLRGHGSSHCPAPGACDPTAEPDYAERDDTWPGRPGDAADSNQLTRDLQRHLFAMQARAPGSPVTLAGHSSGAGLVARFIESAGMAQLAGAALLAPFHHSEQPQNALDAWECGRVVGTTYARVDLGALGAARRGRPHRYVLRLEKEPSLSDARDTLRYTYTMMTGLAVADPNGFHRAFTGSTLWVAGDRDALLDLEASRAEYARLPGGAGFVVVRDTSHVGVSWSTGVARRLASFAKDPSAPGPERIEP